MTIKDVLKFMQEHTVDVFTVNPYNMHMLSDLRHDDITQYHSCFWVPPLMCDILQLQAPNKGKLIYCGLRPNSNRFIFPYQQAAINNLKQPDNYRKMMRPGHYYYLECWNHHLSIIYLRSGEIFYVDYYYETGRETLFRIEQISLTELNRFLKSAIEVNVRGYVRFHKGNADYRKLLKSDLKHIGHSSLIEYIYEQPLTDGIDLKDLRRVLDEFNPSFPISDVDAYSREHYIEEDFEDLPPEILHKAQDRYKTSLQKVLTLLDTTIANDSNLRGDVTHEEPDSKFQVGDDTYLNKLPRYSTSTYRILGDYYVMWGRFDTNNDAAPYILNLYHERVFKYRLIQHAYTDHLGEIVKSLEIYYANLDDVNVYQILSGNQGDYVAHTSFRFMMGPLQFEGYIFERSPVQIMIPLMQADNLELAPLTIADFMKEYFDRETFDYFTSDETYNKVQLSFVNENGEHIRL